MFGKRTRGRVRFHEDPKDPVVAEIVPVAERRKAQAPQGAVGVPTDRGTLDVPGPEKGEPFEHWWLRINADEAIWFALHAKRTSKTPSDLFYQLWRQHSGG